MVAASIDVDSGAYVAPANAVFKNDSTEPATVNCALILESDPLDFDNALDVARVYLAPGESHTLSLIAAVELDAPDTLRLVCYPSGNDQGLSY